MNTIGQVVARPQGAYRQKNIPPRRCCSGKVSGSSTCLLVRGPRPRLEQELWANPQSGSRVCERGSELAPLPLWHPVGAQKTKSSILSSCSDVQLVAGPAGAGANAVARLGEGDRRHSRVSEGPGEWAPSGVGAGCAAVVGAPPSGWCAAGAPARRAHPHKQRRKTTRAVPARVSAGGAPSAPPAPPPHPEPPVHSLRGGGGGSHGRTARHASAARRSCWRHARGVALFGPVGGVTLPLVPLPLDPTWRCRVIVPPSPPAPPLWAHLAPPPRPWQV